MYKLHIRVILNFNDTEARDEALGEMLSMLSEMSDGVTKQGSVQTWDEVEVSGAYIERQNIQTEKIT